MLIRSSHAVALVKQAVGLVNNIRAGLLRPDSVETAVPESHAKDNHFTYTICDSSWFSQSIPNEPQRRIPQMTVFQFGKVLGCFRGLALTLASRTLNITTTDSSSTTSVRE